jgi:Zn-finger protein
MGGFTDGKQDCQIPACPLYPWMPYRQNQGLTST